MKNNFWLSIFVLALVGCATPSAEQSHNRWPEPRPLAKNYPSIRIAEDPQEIRSTEKQIGLSALPEPTGTITLRDALSQALIKNPELAASSWEVRAAEARILQAGAIPNPELEVEVENFGGTGENEGYSSSETTLSIGQLIELGGKRNDRKTVATLERNIAGWDFESKRLDVFSETAEAFVDVLAAQRRVRLADRSLDLAQQVLRAASERVRAGLVSPLEETRSRVRVSTSRIDQEREIRMLAEARQRLAAMWGSTVPDFAEARGDFEDVAAIPPLMELSPQISQNPDVARWSAESDLRQAELALEESQTIPDVTVRGGIRRLEDGEDEAFVASISIPLPVFGLNPGGPIEARRRISQTAEDSRAATTQTRSALNQTYQGLLAAYEEVVGLSNQVLPGATAAFEAARKGYQEGKFDFLEVLDTQRTLLEFEAAYIDALANYHTRKIAAERLIAAPITIKSKLGDGSL